MAFAGIKTLIQKRLDKAKWNLGPITPGGIRLLTDSQGNLIGLVTVPVNPQDADPLAPGSSGNVGLLNIAGVRVDPAGPVDPLGFIGDQGGAQLAYSGTKSNGKVVVIGQQTEATADTFVTLHNEDDTDYQVPSGKTYSIVQALLRCDLTDGIGLGYGDTGVAQGTSAPTNHVVFPWTKASNQILGLLVVATVNTQLVINIAGEVPASKFPVLSYGNASKSVYIQIIGIEHDA